MARLYPSPPDVGRVDAVGSSERAVTGGTDAGALNEARKARLAALEREVIGEADRAAGDERGTTADEETSRSVE